MTTQYTEEQEDDACDYLFKIIFVGDSNVGKTSVISSLESGEFKDKTQNTIGVDFLVHTMDIDGKTVKVSASHNKSIQLLKHNGFANNKSGLDRIKPTVTLPQYC